MLAAKNFKREMTAFKADFLDPPLPVTRATTLFISGTSASAISATSSARKSAGNLAAKGPCRFRPKFGSTRPNQTRHSHMSHANLPLFSQIVLLNVCLLFLKTFSFLEFRQPLRRTGQHRPLCVAWKNKKKRNCLLCKALPA